MRTGRTLFIAALVALLGVPAAAGAPGKLVDKSGDQGFPSVFVTGSQKNVRAFIIRVRAEPNRQVEVRWDTSCAVGGKGKFRLGEFNMSGKGKRRLALGYKRPDECIANALVGYEDSAEGKIRVELFARGG